jgi:hypothetical protein
LHSGIITPVFEEGVMVKSKITVAKYLDQQIALSDKSQKEIAEAVGYDKPNIITMLKQGATKLPINRVGPMAKALNVDPVHLLRLVMSEYMPETWETIEEILGAGTLVSQEEIALLKFIRKHTKGLPIDLEDPRQKTWVSDALEKLMERIEKDRESAVSGARRASGGR